MRLLEKGGLHGLCYLGGGTSMSPYGLGNYAPSHQTGGDWSKATTSGNRVRAALALFPEAQP